MFPFDWTIRRIVRAGLCLILQYQKAILNNQEKTMSALTDLQASVSKLQTDVDAFITANSGGASDADLVALKAAVDAIDAKVAPPAPTT